MLIRISLIVAILAGLAVGVLNFLKVKEKITVLQSDLKRETGLHQEFLKKYTDTQSELDKRLAELKRTKTELADTTAAKEKAETELAAQTKRAEKLTEDLTKANQERDNAQAELAAYKATGVTPKQILAMNGEFKALKDNLAAVEGENRILNQRINKLKAELAVYRDPDSFVVLPAKLKANGDPAKVLVVDPKWNFVVLDVGEDNGILERGELLVNRNGRLVAKVVVRSVQKNRSIANVMPGWELGQVMEGDVVIAAHPPS